MAQQALTERYKRNFNTLSVRDQEQLARARVAVVGLGGLGGGVCEMLARTGVGHLTLIDGDVFEASNLNRQLLSQEANIGCSKAEAAGCRVAAVNSQVAVDVHAVFAGPDNLKDLLQGSDLVVDCLDSIRVRFDLQDAANAVNIPLVSGAIAGVCGQVTVMFPGDPGFELIYQHPGPGDDEVGRGIETRTGNLSFCASYVASLQACEVIKILTGKGTVLRNKLLIADLWRNTMEVMDLL